MIRAVMRRKPPGLLAPTKVTLEPLRNTRFSSFWLASLALRSPAISASTGVSRSIGAISVAL